MLATDALTPLPSLSKVERRAAATSAARLPANAEVRPAYPKADIVCQIESRLLQMSCLLTPIFSPNSGIEGVFCFSASILRRQLFIAASVLASRVLIASKRLSSFSARTTTGMSIILPSSENEPRPAAAASLSI